MGNYLTSYRISFQGKVEREGPHLVPHNLAFPSAMTSLHLFMGAPIEQKCLKPITGPGGRIGIIIFSLEFLVKPSAICIRQATVFGLSSRKVGEPLRIASYPWGFLSPLCPVTMGSRQQPEPSGMTRNCADSL